MARSGWEIVVADSMQVYRRLDIGTAKPPPEVMERLPHHLVGVLEPQQQYTVGDFVRWCERLIPEIRRRRGIPVIAGGCAFYLRTFVCGLPAAPRSDPSLRAQLTRWAEEAGPAALHEELKRVDPPSAARIHPNDRQRVVRALEIWRIGGRPLSSYAQEAGGAGERALLLIGLNRPRPELYLQM